MTQKLHDRLLADAREHAASTGGRFSEALDHAARTSGFADWSEYEAMKDDKTLRGSIAFFDRSLFSDQEWPRFSYIEVLAMRLFGRPVAFARRTVGLEKAGRIAFAAAMALTALCAATSLWLTIDLQGDYHQTPPCLIFAICLYVLGVVGRNWIASDALPTHHGVPALLRYPLYWISTSSLFSVVVLAGDSQYGSASDDLAVKAIAGLWLLASPAWAFAITSVLVRSGEDRR